MIANIYLLDQGFTSIMINSIDSRFDDIEYKFGLVQRDFAREIRY